MIDWGAMMAMLVLAILPIVIFYIVCQKYIIEGVLAGAVKGNLNPIVYMISGFRYGFLGIHDVPLVTTFGVLVVFIAAFYLLCWYLIQRGRGLRS